MIEKKKKWPQPLRPGAPARRTRPPRTRERELLLRGDDRKKRRGIAAKRALYRSSDSSRACRSPQAEFLEAAAAPPVRPGASRIHTTHEGGSRLLPQIEAVQGPSTSGAGRTI